KSVDSADSIEISELNKNTHEKDIAILYICTGKYDVFWKEFYESVEEKFIPHMKKDYFVFTDSKDIYKKENDNVHIIKQKNLGWPGNTLYRFHMFLSQKEKLQNYKYIFFMNANIICNFGVGEEFLPKDEGLLFVQHHAYYKAPNTKFSYERNSNSTAYIPMGQGKYYVCGGVNGGRAKEYLHMCEVLKSRIDEDDKNDVVAVWHDESHINKYLLELEKSQYKLLNVSYCFPEYKMNRKSFPFDPILFFRNKKKYINLKEIKGDSHEMMGNNKNKNKAKNKAIIN
ncbi:glycosyltransferase family 6 protein, partial [Piromyces sp. E2]